MQLSIIPRGNGALGYAQYLPKVGCYDYGPVVDEMKIIYIFLFTKKKKKKRTNFYTQKLKLMILPVWPWEEGLPKKSNLIESQQVSFLFFSFLFFSFLFFSFLFFSFLFFSFLFFSFLFFLVFLLFSFPTPSFPKGARDDLDRVTKMLYAQSTKYGMGETVGPLSFRQARGERMAACTYSGLLGNHIDIYMWIIYM